MIGVRTAGGLLAVAMLAGASACATSEGSAQATTPTVTVASEPPSETLTPLLEQALPGVAGKTFTSAVVDFPPSGRAAPHRHGEAFLYAYVLEGAVHSVLDDKPDVTYHQGESWVEQPGTHHVLTENTSKTDRARLLVIFVSNTGDALKVDDPHS
jgi:quercetin dioxygenase-like cupin family protein